MTGLDRACYTLQEIAQEWRVSKDTVRRIFKREEGVLFINAKHHNTSRGRVMIRIPADVYERVCSRIRNVA